jgi:hypothetical protein
MEKSIDRTVQSLIDSNKAVDIPANSGYPSKLYESLPYAIVDADGRLVSNTQKQPPLGAVKAYWADDVKSILEQYEDAKAMNADEEWLKGLDVQCEMNRVDLARLEKGEPCKQASRPSNQQRNNTAKGQKKQTTVAVVTSQSSFSSPQQGNLVHSLVACGQSNGFQHLMAVSYLGHLPVGQRRARVKLPRSLQNGVQISKRNVQRYPLRYQRNFSTICQPSKQQSSLLCL